MLRICLVLLVVLCGCEEDDISGRALAGAAVCDPLGSQYNARACAQLGR